MIYRTSKKTGNFIQIDKKVIDGDSRISCKAKGILVYMLGKPDDWTFYIKEISQHSTDGVKSIRSGIQELIDTGYIVRNDKQQIKENGDYGGYTYDIYEDCYMNTDMYPNGRISDNDFQNFLDEIDDVISDG